MPDTREHIIASLKNSTSLQTSQIEEQFDLLILQPLKRTTTLRYRPVMVIDGVDECIDETMLVRFLRVLVRAGEGGRLPVRFMICSRPEPRIRTILGIAHNFNPTADGQELQLSSLLDRVMYLVTSGRLVSYRHTQRGQSFAKVLWEPFRPIRVGIDKHAPSSSDTSSELADALDRICPHPVISTIQIGFSEECKHDIANYLTYKFNAIPRPAGDGTNAWFQPCDISDLVEASCGQFLYASTISRLLDEPHIDPGDILEMARRGLLPTPDLNKLYKAILKRAEDTIRNQAQDGGSNYETEWQYVMDSLKILTGKLTSKLGKMHSVLSIVPGESVRMHHRSFLEFLQSRERSGGYHIPSSTALRRILILMGRAGLRNNIFLDNDSRRLYIEDMIIACRNRSPVQRDFQILMRMSASFSVRLILRLMGKVFLGRTLTLSVLSECLLLFLVLCGTFILSLTIYSFFLDRSIIVPFFHPFLNTFFDRFLVPSRLLFLFLCTSIVFSLQ
ncbi:hypothetical protein M378DRAFT_168033 [Amanita muscaria Koide BX008]|uniref:Nephrocystin 3-like N-terminal domain-containing protein n=1 Tax=Amanita muscaria (strain Koide BX008) TaxID=946122 RepID=A0A0C2WGJ3_AMAMK|nr:hypothetical protein M378DRAFT_168033 [Amanita muscaria Koide BX008]